jgi:hypothetical protein
MRYHLSIAPAGSADVAFKRMAEAARSDSRVFVVDRGKLGQWLAFSATPEMRADEERHFAERGRMTPGACVLWLSPELERIQVNQECVDDSRRVMLEFVRWILREFAPCRVFDDDSGEELTEDVARNPLSIFGD